MSALEDELLLQIQAAGLPEPVREYRFDAHRRYRFDLAYPAPLWIAIECDGGIWVQGRHNRPQGYERDCMKLNLAALQGWLVLRVTGAMVRDGRALQWVEDALRQEGVGA